MLHEAAGQPLPHLQGGLMVPDGAVFLASQVLHSLDGRYFGMTPVVDITARAIPLVV